MFSKTIILALFATTAIAAPLVTESGAAAIEARQDWRSVKICSNAGLDDCDEISFTYGNCVGNVGRLNDKVSSLNANGYKCRFYTDTGCRNGAGNIATDGEINDIRGSSNPAISTQNDDISSFICNLVW
ncbi:hypothetical protein ACEPPN_014358 [Leptodophora sp. 'Broadleaf-Isolate-01']